MTPKKRSLKKNLAQKMEEYPDAELYFSDEARFGTHSNIGHGWFPTGSRTTVKIKVGYQNFYIYGAVNPILGKHFELLLPRANTVCMNVFLEEFSKTLDGKKCIFVLDGAGWHKSKDLIIPSNLIIMFLPPYSPELNPIERLWLYIKQGTIRNQIYHTIKSLEDAVCEFVNDLKDAEVVSICKYGYMSS
jgi:transposase